MASISTSESRAVMRVGHVPLIRYRRPGDPAVADEVAQLASNVRAVLLEGLGPVVWEKSVSQASYAPEELEETAQPQRRHVRRARLVETISVNGHPADTHCRRPYSLDSARVCI
jgi:ribulose-5-phosphate 4-epimerase/fuculose-1-phosphate aldolase